MNIPLSARTKKLIEEQVKSGRYASPAEVVRDALRALDERERIRASRLEALRRDIEVGERDIREGRFTRLRTARDFTALANRITSQGKRAAGTRRKRAA